MISGDPTNLPASLAMIFLLGPTLLLNPVSRFFNICSLFFMMVVILILFYKFTQFFFNF